MVECCNLTIRGKGIFKQKIGSHVAVCASAWARESRHRGRQFGIHKDVHAKNADCKSPYK